MDIGISSSDPQSSIHGDQCRYFLAASLPRTLRLVKLKAGLCGRVGNSPTRGRGSVPRAARKKISLNRKWIKLLIKVWPSRCVEAAAGGVAVKLHWGAAGRRGRKEAKAGREMMVQCPEASSDKLPSGHNRWIPSTRKVENLKL